MNTEYPIFEFPKMLEISRVYGKNKDDNPISIEVGENNILAILEANINAVPHIVGLDRNSIGILIAKRSDIFSYVYFRSYAQYLDTLKKKGLTPKP